VRAHTLLEIAKRTTTRFRPDTVEARGALPFRDFGHFIEVWI